MNCDLHVHSLESDGRHSVSELVDLAFANDVGAVALCDHDTTAGCAEFVRRGKMRGVNALAGIEMSAGWKGGNCHILGLSVDLANDELESVLVQTRESRARRNVHILEKLDALGMRVTIDQLLEEAGGDVIARPHIAYALVKRGYVATFQEAFDKYLSNGRCAYVDRYRLTPAECVKLLRRAGAFVALAHPRQLRISDDELFNFLADMKRAGLQGVEVYAPDTTDEQVERYGEMARLLSLAETGGSDFHSSSLGGRKIGYYRSDVRIPKLEIAELGLS